MNLLLWPLYHQKVEDHKEDFLNQDCPYCDGYLIHSILAIVAGDQNVEDQTCDEDETPTETREAFVVGQEELNRSMIVLKARM